MLLLVDWRLAVIALAVFLVTRKLVFKDETWPSMIGVGLTPPLVWWFTASLPIMIAVLLVSVIVIVKHLPDAREGFYVAMRNEQ